MKPILKRSNYLIKILILLVLCLCLLVACSSKTTTYKTEPRVYITDTGNKYHSIDCGYLHSSLNPIGLYKAIDAGYTACSRCGGHPNGTISVKYSSQTNNSNGEIKTMIFLIILGSLISLSVVFGIISTLNERAWTKYHKIEKDWDSAQKDFNKKTEELNHERKSLDIERQTIQEDLEKQRIHLKELQDELEMQSQFQVEQIQKLDKIVESRCKYYPELSVVMADILTAHYEDVAQFLCQKRNPAKVEATRIRELREETQKILQEKKLYEYQLLYLRSVIPDIDKYFDCNSCNTTKRDSEK